MIPTPFLFVLAAVAFVVWWNGRPAGPAPFPPLPAPPAKPAVLFPQPAPSAHAGGGMNPLLLGAILIPWGLLAFSRFANHERPTPAPEPTPVVGLDLRGAFVGPTAAGDASLVERLMGDLSHTISIDGTIDFDGDGTIDPPRLLTGQQLSELRRVARAYATDGVSLADRQPKAIDLISAYLTDRVGTSGGPVDAAAKRAWAAAFDDVRKAAAAAAGR